MSDPSGHCATSQPSASDTDAYEEWSSCWTSVNTILQQWDATPDYFNGRYGSKEWFGERIAKRSDLGADYFSDEIMRWVQSDDYAAWQADRPVPPNYDSPDFGDYTAINWSFGFSGGAFILDDYHSIYLRYDNNFVGSLGVGISRGDIGVSNGDGTWTDIDQLELSKADKAALAPNILVGASRGGSAGFAYMEGGFAYNLQGPPHVTVEAGAVSSPVSLSYSHASYTFQIYPVQKFK